MKRISDRRPVWLTKQRQEDIYSRWRELMVAVFRHNGMLVAHPKWKGFYKEMMMRLAEDPFWINGVMLLPDQEPVMMFKVEIPQDNLYAWTPKGGIQTPSQFMGPTGFGRLGWKAPSEDGVQPWETAKVPKGEQKPLTPEWTVPTEEEDDQE